MGIYSSYLDQNLEVDEITKLRKEQLARISRLRGRAVFVYASDFTSPAKAPRAPVALDPSDTLPVSDQLDNLSGDSIDVILETPGGHGTVAEDIVHILREKYSSVAFIVPGQAKSAGTIMVMSGDEILMDYRSAVGPIDAQITFEGKQFSAEALLKGKQEIAATAEKSGSLNRAYIPILQRLSPGDIQNAQNALDFARFLVRDWLCAYKFRNWNVHRTHDVGAVVTSEQKRARAQAVADALCDHSRWLSHGKSIRIKDLRDLGLEITDYATAPELSDAISRYQALLRLTFDKTPIFKLIETPTSQINRVLSMPQPSMLPFLQASQPAQGQNLPFRAPIQPNISDGVLVDFNCAKCGHCIKIQADFDTVKPLRPSCIHFPADDTLLCPTCRTVIPLTDLRQNLEFQSKRKVATK